MSERIDKTKRFKLPNVIGFFILLVIASVFAFHFYGPILIGEDSDTINTRRELKEIYQISTSFRNQRETELKEETLSEGSLIRHIRERAPHIDLSKYTVPDSSSSRYRIVKRRMNKVPTTEMLIAWETAANKNGMRSVLFLDGHVTQLDEAEFKELVLRYE